MGGGKGICTYTLSLHCHSILRMLAPLAIKLTCLKAKIPAETIMHGLN